MVIPYQATKLAIWDSSKFNSHQYFQLYSCILRKDPIYYSPISPFSTLTANYVMLTLTLCQMNPFLLHKTEKQRNRGANPPPQPALKDGRGFSPLMFQMCILFSMTYI